MEKTEYLIEYKPKNEVRFRRNGTCFPGKEKELVLKIAKSAKKDFPYLGVRVVEQKRKVIKVF